MASFDDPDPIHAVAMLAIDDDIPVTYRQAVSSPELTNWKRAI